MSLERSARTDSEYDGLFSIVSQLNIILLAHQGMKYLRQELYAPNRRGFDTKHCLLDQSTIHYAKSHRSSKRCRWSSSLAPVYACLVHGKQLL